MLSQFDETVGPAVTAAVTAAVIEYVRMHGVPPDPASAAQEIADSIDMSPFESLVDPVENALLPAFEGGGYRMSVQIRTALFDQVHDAAIAYAKDRAAEMIGMVYDEEGQLVPDASDASAEMAITDTTRERIRELVVEAMSPGTGHFDLAGAIADLQQGSAPLFSAERAAIIARAEVGMAHNFGMLAQLNAAADTGIKLRKKWSTAKDVKVCLDICAQNEAAGPIALGKAFPSGHMAPLGHPRCRCALIGVTEEE